MNSTKRTHIKIEAYKIFKPELTPREMLEAGVFGGHYFKGNYSEYPQAWFRNAKLNDDEFDVNLNYFKIKAGLTKEQWLSKGWIFNEDPLGWFQWYCRFYQGRRIVEIDQIQIMRWYNFGPRHIGAIKKIVSQKITNVVLSKGKHCFNGHTAHFFRKNFYFDTVLLIQAKYFSDPLSIFIDITSGFSYL